MDFNNLILTLILFSPIVRSIVVLIIGKLGGDRAAKWSALIFSLVPLALTIYLWIAYQDPINVANANGYKFAVEYPWFPQINSWYRVGVDGIGLSMILLTAILTPLGVLISFRITERVPLFMML